MNWQLAVAALGVLATVISIGFNDQTARAMQEALAPVQDTLT